MITPAFRRLDHLLCHVADLRAAFELFHEKLGFPVAWPIGRYWPHWDTCGLALGGANLELIQAEGRQPAEATIRQIAFEPTECLEEVLKSQDVPFTSFEKRESNPELLRLRGLPADQGPQFLCRNTIPDAESIEFPLFACDYSPIAKAKIAPSAFEIPGGNKLEKVVLGHPHPERLQAQLAELGIQEGVQVRVEEHPEKELVALVMKNGPINLSGFPARFEFR